VVELAGVKEDFGDFLDGDIRVLVTALRLEFGAADKQ
jgi:hypothetical protein